MSHVCQEYWGAAAQKLTLVLGEQTSSERAAALKGVGGNPKHPRRRAYEGWIHRVASEKDYDALLGVYYGLCLALKQPTDIPNHWNRSTFPGQAKLVESQAFGELARKVLIGLKSDGEDMDASRARPFHSGTDDPNGQDVPRYGTPNWLEKPPGLCTGESLVVARNLLRALRGAMNR